MVYGSSLPQLAVVHCNEPSFLPCKIINVNNVHYINMLRDHLQCNPASIPFIPYVHFYLKKHASYWQVEFSSQVKHEDSDLFPKNGTSAVIREGNILKMQHKQKPCTPLPSNKQSRYYRPRVKVSTRTDSWSDVFCSSKTSIYLIFCTVSEGGVFALSQGRFVSKAYFLQQQQALEKES